MTSAVIADYLQSIGAPPDAGAWPDNRVYPALVPPRVYAFLVAHDREQHGRPLPARWAKHRATEPDGCYVNAAASSTATQTSRLPHSSAARTRQGHRYRGSLRSGLPASP